MCSVLLTLSKYCETITELTMNPKLPPIPKTIPKGTQNQVALVANVQQNSPSAIAVPLRKDTTLIPNRFIIALVIGEKL